MKPAQPKLSVTITPLIVIMTTKAFFFAVTIIEL